MTGFSSLGVKDFFSRFVDLFILSRILNWIQFSKLTAIDKFGSHPKKLLKNHSSTLPEQYIKQSKIKQKKILMKKLLRSKNTFI